MLQSGYLVIIFATLAFCETLNETELLSKCKTEKTFAYNYNTFYHIEGQHISSDGVMIRFYVKARSDAHILLSSKAYPSDDDPVYEIVLGAGRNTFSDIRRSKRSKTQSTTNTPNILSIYDFRAFWVLVSHNGILSVGEGNNNVPLLFWQDPDPLFIRYFSFSTWSGVAGIWLFDCSPDADNEVTVVEQNLLPIERLRRDLLTYYDPFVRPSIDDEPTTVSLHLSAHHVRLNERKGIMTVLGKMVLQWNDQKLRWNARDYGGVSQIHIGHHEVWLPDLALYNTASPATEILDGTMLLAQKDGSIKWESQAKLTAWCSLDLSFWPQDAQICSLDLGFLSQGQDVKLLLIDNATKLEEQKTNSEWSIVQLNTEITWARTPWITSDSDNNDDSDNEAEDSRFSEVPDTVLRITYTLERHIQTYNVIITVPFIVASTMTLMSFWISPKDYTKLFISCVNLVLLSVILVTLEDIIPAPADHTPYLVIMYSWSMLSTAISLITSVLVICLVRYPHSQQLPEFLWNIISSSITRMILCLPEQDPEDSENYTQLIENSTPARDSHKSSGTQHQWILLAMVIDRICFTAYLLFFSVILLSY